MRKFTNFLIAGAFALSMVATGAVQAAPNAEVTITSTGSRVVSIEAIDFGDKTYSFSTQTATASAIVKVEDNTGSGSGWNVTLQGVDFERDASTKIAIGNLSLAAGTPASTAGQATTGITAPAITVGTGPAKIASAPALSGMGHYTITYPGTLTVPGGTLVGDYKSTLTVSITAGP